MSLYSIEQGAEQIYHPKTKEYFKEVLQSYVNGSYRSAIVMLYSVVMCDLVYKLKDLKELYEDKIAISILEKIEEEQARNTTNPGAWEGILIDEVKTRTLLLEPSEKITLDSLRQHRHLSAHPVLTQEDLLLTPNKETARALIRNMLEGLLIKNPVMTKKVFNTLLEDIGEHKNIFLDDLSLENYIESRYLKNTNEHMINTIFKDLWSITFNCINDPCKKNREINFCTLKILYKKFKSSLLKYIEENLIPFNKFKENDTVIVRKLTEFLGDNPELYSFIESHNQTKLKAKIESNGSLKVRAPFLIGSMEKHFDYLIDSLHGKEYTYEESFFESYILDRSEREILFKWASENDCIEKYYDLLIKQFVHSGNFDTADINYDAFIKENLSKFNREQFLALYDGINRNRQCHAHRYAKFNNTQIKVYSDLILGADFDYKGKFTRVEFKEDQ